jgi:hypothetical protein
MKTSLSFRLPALTALLCALYAPLSHAGAADYVYTLNIEQGESELDMQYGTARQADGSRIQTTSVALGYGVSEHWFTEGYLKRDRASNATLAEWENKFLVFESGQFKMGFLTELAAPLSGSAPWELRVGTLLQTSVDKWQLNANLLFERAFGKADEHGVPYATNIAYQFQAQYRWQPTLGFGVQALGDMGRWNQWDTAANQNHRIGPAVFGKFGKDISYNAAWLFGSSRAAPSHTLRMQLEYEL